MDYQDKLFENYNRTHVSNVDVDDKEKLEWFKKYINNYINFISCDKEKSKILEIGCNKGFLLKSLELNGFKNLYGIDLSPIDIEYAKLLVKNAIIINEDVFEYLIDKTNTFDVIIMKAVLEHINKESTLSLLNLIKNSLTKDGIVIIDVPNMDWIFASHERYMDFTHEVGFTKESLRQILSFEFNHVEIVPVDNITTYSIMGSLKKQTSRYLINKLLSWADEQGANNPIWARNLIGVGKNRK